MDQAKGITIDNAKGNSWKMWMKQCLRCGIRLKMKKVPKPKSDVIWWQSLCKLEVDHEKAVWGEAMD